MPRDYWQYQLPLWGSYRRMQDDQRYWDDYRKNTGFSPRYSGRHYGDYGTRIYHESLSMGKMFMKALK